MTLALLLVLACNQGVLDPDDTGISDDTSEDTADTHDHDTTDTHDTGDTGDPHDTGDTADTGIDTGHHDTGDTGDTGSCGIEDSGLPIGSVLPDLIPLTPAGVRLSERLVTESDCAWVEGCVGGLGRRRLLRFDGSIANIGLGDVAFGDPADHPAYFEYSLCHGHYHFTGFANFDLTDGDGNVVAAGHKQSFCLLDSGRYLSDASPLPHYTCANQGISSGWYDVYGGHLDCQWVDVTDLAPGTYVLRVAIDPTGLIPETDDANNVVTVQVEVPTTDITRACTATDPPSLSRDCGWTLEATRTCQPGALQTLGCTDAGACGLGCNGDPMVRVCEGDASQCLAGGAWAANDDGCSTTCPRTAFPCPPSGVYTTWVAPYGNTPPPTCTVSVTTGEIPDPTDPCPGSGIDGDHRECGWTVGTTGTCTPGDAIWVGCDPSTCGLDVCPSDPIPPTLEGMDCAGDPMLRACRGSEPCDWRASLALGEDACRQDCPAAIFTCPAEGAFTVLVAPERVGRPYDCVLGYAPVADINAPDAP